MKENLHAFLSSVNANQDFQNELLEYSADLGSVATWEFENGVTLVVCAERFSRDENEQLKQAALCEANRQLGNLGRRPRVMIHLEQCRKVGGA